MKLFWVLFLKAFLSQRIIIVNVGKRNGYVVTHSGLGIEKELCLKKGGFELRICNFALFFVG